MSPPRFKTPGWSVALVAAALAAGCGGSTINLFPDVTPSEDARDDATSPPDASPPDATADGGGRCASNADCRAGQFCAGTGCGTPGTCQTRPDACPELYSPVCGCDGRTYGASDCEANGAGVRVAYRGACSAVDGGADVPGDARPDVGADGSVRTCRTAADCGTGGEECVFPETGCAATGVCSLPTPCFRAVTFCGCDGVTYEGCRPTRPNRSVGACNAVDAGVDAAIDARPDVAIDAAPDATGSFCAAALCMAGTFCCEARRACLPPGEACTASGTCTGDAQCVGSGYACCAGTGRCYDTRCLACCMVAPGGCASNADCAATQYCAGAGCGTRGTCQARPSACTTLYAPVCGCDGRTYSNECTANSAGQRAASTGVCPTADAGVDAAVDAGPARCTTASECARGQECVFPETACSATGSCQAAIACLIPNTYCSCANVTYQGCRPDRPTQSTGACATTTPFCLTARCTATTYCCEARRACVPLAEACSTTGRCASDAECGSGYSCCAGTGACYASACLACCMVVSTGCASNADCRATQWCAGTGCGTRGTCADRPGVCSTLYAPVCGCDRRTYSNECSAAGAGVRVASTGACP